MDEANRISARMRLENAFWKQLEEKPFSKITARGLAKDAGVNHNTFYRYFDNTKDMATKLFNDLIVEEIPPIMIAAANTGSIPHLPTGIKPDPLSVSRAILFARSESPTLISMLEEQIMDTWLKALNISKSNLSEIQCIELSIIFGGLVSAMGNKEIDPNPGMIPIVIQRPLVKAIVSSLLTIKNEQEGF